MSECQRVYFGELCSRAQVPTHTHAALVSGAQQTREAARRRRQRIKQRADINNPDLWPQYDRQYLSDLTVVNWRLTHTQWKYSSHSLQHESSTSLKCSFAVISQKPTKQTHSTLQHTYSSDYPCIIYKHPSRHQTLSRDTIIKIIQHFI